jgi:ADP-ribosylglycohydrolase
MLGAIVGDVIGSVHEWAGTKTKHSPLFVEETTFTDDSVLTVAVAEWILTGTDLVDLLHSYTEACPDVGMGACFTTGPGAARASLTTALAMVPPCESAQSGLRSRPSRRYSSGPSGAPK